MKNQKLILSPKDNVGKIVLQNVDAFCLEGDTLLVVFNDGGTRNYPLTHLWYYESHVSYHRESLVSDDNGLAHLYYETEFVEGDGTGESLPDAVGVGAGVGFDLTDDDGIHTPDSDNRAERYRAILAKELAASENDSDDSLDLYNRGFVHGWRQSLSILDREFQRVDDES